MSQAGKKITSSEIREVAQVLSDKQAIEVLKKIRDNQVNSEDIKKEQEKAVGAKGSQDEREKEEDESLVQFEGFTHQDDVLGQDPNSGDYQQKRGAIDKLLNAGFIIEGFHIPLGPRDQEKHGGQRFPSERKISKFQLTEEGFTLLSTVKELSGIGSSSSSNNDTQVTKNQSQSGAESEQQGAKRSTEEEQESTSTTTKRQQIGAFKESVRRENGRR
jgi:DNA-binding HxlR family transcriptional regulator